MKCSVFQAAFCARIIIASVLLATLAGCSSFKGLLDKDEDTDTQGPEYKTLPALEVPPDLDKPTGTATYLPPEQQAGAVQTSVSPSQAKSQLQGRVAPRWQGVLRMRDGQQSWLLVNATPEQIWPLIGQFLTEHGYRIAMSEPAIGIMETDWRSVDQAGVADLQERLRIRVEPSLEAGRSEVFVSQRNTSSLMIDNDRAVEMLNRLAQYLGGSKIDDSQPLLPRSSSVTESKTVTKEDVKDSKKSKGDDFWKELEEDCSICVPGSRSD